MSASQRSKGQRGEREFCAALGEHLGESLYRELSATRDGGPDVLIGTAWAVEVKRGEELQLASWWRQACEQAAAQSRYPALAYRQNRQSWQIRVPLDIVLWGTRMWYAESTLDWTATLSIAGFATVVRETLPEGSRKPPLEDPMPLYLKKLTKTALCPTRATDGSAGLDLYADEEVTIPEYTRCWVSTGIALSIDPGYCGLIWPRSGLAGAGLDTSAGVIDSDYRGDARVLLCNGTPHRKKVHQGDRIAQLLIVPASRPTLIDVESLPDSERGTSGFGSTGL